MTTSTPLRDDRIRPLPASDLLLVTMLGLGLAISGAPSPLYEIYQRTWEFSALMLAMVFAVYAFAALAGTLLVGRISDRWGRKPVLLTAQALLLAGIVIFVLAGSAWWLLVARALHGLAIGGVVVTAAAALLDRHPHRGAAVGRACAVSVAAGMALGVLGTALLSQYGPFPLITPYVVLAALTLVTLAGTTLMDETLRAPAARHPLVMLPRVPPAIREDFLFAACGVFAAWAVLGLALSFGPQLAARTTGSASPLVGGGVIAVLLVGAGITQLLMPLGTSVRLAARGDLVLAAGLALNLLGVLAHSGWAVYATTALIGVGYGIVFGCSLKHLTAVIPPQCRGEVMSAYYLVAYSSLAVPVVLTGYASRRFGLIVTYAAFVVVVVAVCVVAAYLSRRIATHDGAAPPRA